MRHLRVSVRGFLCGFAVIGCVLSWVAHCRREETRQQEIIHTLSHTRINVKDVWLAGTWWRAGYGTVRQLSIYDSTLDREQVELISRLHHVRYIKLGRCQTEVSHLSELAALRQLVSIQLHHCRLGVDGAFIVGPSVKRVDLVSIRCFGGGLTLKANNPSNLCQVFMHDVIPVDRAAVPVVDQGGEP